MITTKKCIPPVSVKKNAQKGLDFRKEYGRGGTRIGMTRAHQLIAQADLSTDIIKRMVSYFARHEVDKKASDFGNDNNPSNGYIAWLLWGGDEGKEWAEAMKKEIENT